MMVTDSLGRPLATLRISVTDRCNLRCGYCMPEACYQWLASREILRFEEIARLARIFARLGTKKLRLTGGEPLLRRDLPALVAQLARACPDLPIGLTTNGVRLAETADALRAAGIDRVTVSLDTLSRERFRRIARRDELPRVLAGIEAARAAGFARLKLNTVVLAGTNDDELPELLLFARAAGAELRFIEYMDVGGATRWEPDSLVTRDLILARIEERLGPVTREGRRAAPETAERFRLADGTPFGIIASMSRPFCVACDRARLTADGMLYRCLYARTGLDLKALLRGGATDDGVAGRIREAWAARADRGAELRAGSAREALAASTLASDPHLEMHTRGG